MLVGCHWSNILFTFVSHFRSMGKTENFGKTHLSLGPRVEGDRCMEAIPAVYSIDIPKRVAVVSLCNNLEIYEL